MKAVWKPSLKKLGLSSFAVPWFLTSKLESTLSKFESNLLK
jgi:hypothetical protein